MVKKLVIISILALTGIFASAQNIVSGRIIDALTNAPEPGAVVQLFSGASAENNNMKGYALSDSLGVFSIPYKNIASGTECTV